MINDTLPEDEKLDRINFMLESLDAVFGVDKPNKREVIAKLYGKLTVYFALYEEGLIIDGPNLKIDPLHNMWELAKAIDNMWHHIQK